MKLVKIISDERVAKLLADPMRRAILNILREMPMTEAGLARRLGLTDATVNYHLGMLRRAKLVTIVKREMEAHGLIQKFYLPTSYLFLADVEHLDPEVARYYVPIDIERIRGALSAFRSAGLLQQVPSGAEIDSLAEQLARILVGVGRKHEDVVVAPGTGEAAVNSIYAESITLLLRAKFPRSKRRKDCERL